MSETMGAHHRRYAAQGLHCGNLDCEVCPWLVPTGRVVPAGPVPVQIAVRGAHRRAVRRPLWGGERDPLGYR